MFSLMIWIAALAIILSGVAYFGGFLQSKGLITGLAALTIGIGLISYPIGHHIAQRGAIGGFHQFLNGSIVGTDVDRTTCHEDGSCHQTYNCDPYFVTVVDSAAYTDKDGNYHPEVSHVETRYHDCPYATEEYTYKVTDSLGGEHTVASHIFAASPHAWRSGESLPSNVPRGVPKLWQEAQDGIETNNLYPITLPSTYDNYILADQHTILRESSDDIEALKKLKLLPDHTHNLHDPFYNQFNADKVSFVGFTPANAADWQQELMYFNAALGMTLRGDLHVVAIKASALPSSVSPRAYLLTLKAYWLNDLGKYAFAKNGVVLVLGVDDTASTVIWSQASTGMPVGNGTMLAALSSLDNTPFTLDALFGSTTAKVVSKDGKTSASYIPGSGIVPQTMMVEYPFARACMECKDKSEASEQGFTYLSTDIPLSGGALVGTILVDYFLILLMWGAMVATRKPGDNFGSFSLRPLGGKKDTYDRYEP